ncbi:MAG TPA: hypothetical protein VGF89_13360 [Steroidobacteraceae bacterium]
MLLIGMKPQSMMYMRTLDTAFRACNGAAAQANIAARTRVSFAGIFIVAEG